jgi:hypothetical protein
MPSPEKSSSKETVDPDVVAVDPYVATLMDDIFGELPSSTPTKDSTDGGSLVDPDASPRDILRDRISIVLNGIDCNTVKQNGFAHLFNNIFTPLEDFSIFKLMELRRLSWSTLKCPQVCIIIYYQLML